MPGKLMPWSNGEKLGTGRHYGGFDIGVASWRLNLFRLAGNH